MSDLSALYPTVIRDHSATPRNFGRLAEATHRAAGENPLCGDTVLLELALDGETVIAARFAGSACAVATASASLLTESVQGRTVAETRALVAHMHALCGGARSAPRAATGGGAPAPDRLPAPSAGALAEGLVADASPALAVFAAVGRHPLRAKCALLAWQALSRALERPAAAAEVRS